jgi:hypothetical protein
MNAHGQNLMMLAAMLNQVEGEHKCDECCKYFPSDKVREIGKRDQGEWLRHQVCADCEPEFVRNGWWRE